VELDGRDEPEEPEEPMELHVLKVDESVWQGRAGRQGSVPVACTEVPGRLSTTSTPCEASLRREVQARAVAHHGTRTHHRPSQVPYPEAARCAAA
jgi:hypothetical protein